MRLAARRTTATLIDAELALNEGGGGAHQATAEYRVNGVQASEKVVQSFRLEVTNKGGHSSLPVKDNAIYRLAEGLTRLAQADFPVAPQRRDRDLLRAHGRAHGRRGRLGADMRAVAGGVARPRRRGAGRRRRPVYNARMRTTCVATRLEGGHADNALPQTATRGRQLPHPARRDARGRRSARSSTSSPTTSITVTPIGPFFPSPPSPLTPEVMRAVEAVTREMWPGVPVVPTMSTGATDSRYLRAAGIPAYGISGIFGDIDDVRAHGRDERILVRSLYEGQEYLYRLVKLLSSP